MGQGQGSVYFILTADERFVKIGFSVNLAQSFSAIKMIGPGTRDCRMKMNTGPELSHN